MQLPLKINLFAFNANLWMIAIEIFHNVDSAPGGLKY